MIHPAPANDAIEILDTAITRGFAPPARPGCDSGAICGPGDKHHVARECADLLGNLAALPAKP